MQRRGFLAAVLGAAGAALVTRTMHAFGSSAEGLFTGATKHLSGFGISVGGAFDSRLGHDVLTLRILPQADIQYDELIGELNPAGGINPCFLVSRFNEAFEATAFDVNLAGGIAPCWRAQSERGLISFDVFDPNEAGGIQPCFHTSVNSPAGSGPQSIEVALDTATPRFSFAVMVGGSRYELQDGMLVLVR